MKKIKRALISVTDKSGIVPIVKTLIKFGCEIISTGGTKKHLLRNNLDVTDISKFTGNPEAFQGRIKTISFEIGAGILFKRKEHKKEAHKLDIKPIDIVICNLYRFPSQDLFFYTENDNKKNEASIPPDKVISEDDLMENIDIGGSFMIRAAAKNYKDVAVVVDTNDYNQINRELQANEGSISLKTREYLMRKAFNYTASYDANIATTMNNRAGNKSLRLSFRNGKKLRYGENPHQKAIFFNEEGQKSLLDRIKQYNGKALSYNNIIDISAALETVYEFQSPASSIVKHTNPCGLASGPNMKKNLELAWSGDPISAFGSIVAFNQKINKEIAQFFELKNKDKSKRKFIEVIIAPDYTQNAIEYLSIKKSLRVLKYRYSKNSNFKNIKYLKGTLILQEEDTKLYDKLEIVSERKPEKYIGKNIFEFGLKTIKHIKSNAIILVRKIGDSYQLIGMGAGQPNRVVSVRLAISKAKENLRNEFIFRKSAGLIGKEDKFEDYYKREMKKVVLVSDAFFPFSDSIVEANKEGINIFIQPGGSIRDKSVIKKCDELNCSMIFTGIRHFKH